MQDVIERIRRGIPEDELVDYKSKGVKNWKVTKDLTAFANTKGGSVILGVPEEDGQPATVQHVERPHSRVDEVADAISSHTSPVLDFERTIHEIDGKNIIEFSVTHSDQLYSFTFPGEEEPVFPVRRLAVTDYLSGHEVNEHFESIYSQRETEKGENDLLRLPEDELEEFDNYFIKAPDGHISDICLFSNIYYPSNPSRILLKSNKISTARVEHIFALLEAIFTISGVDSYFTINQSNGAWIGEGFRNFVSNLLNQSERYRLAREKEKYEIDTYKHEQAVFIADFGMVYPESVLLLYAAPYVNHEKHRHFTLNLLIDGTPVDVRPLIEFAERAGIHLDTSKQVNVPKDGIEGPSRIPVDIIERSTQGNMVDGVVCRNPFFDNASTLEQLLDLDGVDPLSKYERVFGHLIHYDGIENPEDYESKRFVVTDWNEFTRGIYANVKEVHFDVNW